MFNDRFGAFLALFCGSFVAFSVVFEPIIERLILPAADYKGVVTLVVVLGLSFVTAWQLSKIFSKKLK